MCSNPEASPALLTSTSIVRKWPGQRVDRALGLETVAHVESEDQRLDAEFLFQAVVEGLQPVRPTTGDDQIVTQFASARAVAAPMPEEAPVINAVLLMCLCVSFSVRGASAPRAADAGETSTVRVQK